MLNQMFSVNSIRLLILMLEYYLCMQKLRVTNVTESEEASVEKIFEKIKFS